MSFPDSSIQQSISGSGNIFTATGDVFVIQKPESATDRQVQGNLRILLNKVRTFWIQGVLEKSIHHAVLLNLEKEVRTDSVDHPWGMVLELPDNERYTLPPKTDIIEIFNRSTRALLILGEPGSGKTTTLLDLARKLIEKAEQDISTEPIPVVFNLSSWGTSKSLFDWLVKELSEKYQIPKKIGKIWLEQNRLLPLLDGFDEIAEPYRQNCINSINEFIGIYGLPGMVVCSRITEYTSLSNRLKLNAAICVQPLTNKQTDQYLKTAIGKDHSLKGLLKKDDLLAGLAKTPLFLSILCLAHRNSPEEVKNLSADSPEEYTKKIFDIYIKRVLQRKGEKNPYTTEQAEKTLAWLAKGMVKHNQSVFYTENLQPSWLSYPRDQLIYYVLSRAFIWLLIGFLGTIGAVSFSYIFIPILIGVVLSLWSSTIVVFDWQPIKKSVIKPTIYNKHHKLLAQLLSWGRFIYLQSIVIVLFLYTINWGKDHLGIFVVLSPLVFVVLQALFCISLWKLQNFPIHILTNPLIVWAILLSYVIYPSVISLILGPPCLGGLLLILSWVSGKAFIKVRAGLNSLPVLFGIVSIIVSIIGFLIERIDLQSFMWIGISPITIGIITTTINAFGKRYKNRLSDVRLTENLSWSWKRSFPFAVIAAFSLLFFIFTSRFMNEVALRDSKTGTITSVLQKAPFIHWNASYSNDGSRLILLGAKSLAHSYLYDAYSGNLISDMGTQQLPVRAIFNTTGSRLLVEGSGECPGCFAQLWDTKTGKLVNQLNVYNVPKPEEINEFGPFWFADDSLIFTSITLSDLPVQERYTDAYYKSLRVVYIIWEAETGNPVLFLEHKQDSTQLDIQYIFRGSENHQAVDMSQISELIIYDDFILKYHPITLRNSDGQGNNHCYWFTQSHNIDCPQLASRPNIFPWEPRIIFMRKFEDGISIFGFPGQTASGTFLPQNDDTGVLTYSSGVIIVDKLSSFYENTFLLGTKKINYPNYINNIDSTGVQNNNQPPEAPSPVNLLVDVYPYATIKVFENPALPQLITITDGNNILAYIFGYLSVFALAALFLTGLNTSMIEKKTLPNQGILLSLRNSLILGELMAVAAGLLTYILYILFLAGNEAQIYTMGLGLLAGTIVWAFYGGKDVVFHYTLRLIMAKCGYLPWKLVPFLDYCADNLLLQKVGGGYIFIHRMLLENLAKKYKD